MKGLGDLTDGRRAIVGAFFGVNTLSNNYLVCLVSAIQKENKDLSKFNCSLKLINDWKKILEEKIKNRPKNIL